jgi:hypothetical protein
MSLGCWSVVRRAPVSFLGWLFMTQHAVIGVVTVPVILFQPERSTYILRRNAPRPLGWKWTRPTSQRDSVLTVHGSQWFRSWIGYRYGFPFKRELSCRNGTCMVVFMGDKEIGPISTYTMVARPHLAWKCAGTSTVQPSHDLLCGLWFILVGSSGCLRESTVDDWLL